MRTDQEQKRLDQIGKKLEAIKKDRQTRNASTTFFVESDPVVSQVDETNLRVLIFVLGMFTMGMLMVIAFSLGRWLLA